jgi:hypothetical protein
MAVTYNPNAPAYKKRVKPPEKIFRKPMFWVGTAILAGGVCFGISSATTVSPEQQARENPPAIAPAPAAPVPMLKVEKKEVKEEAPVVAQATLMAKATFPSGFETLRNKPADAQEMKRHLELVNTGFGTLPDLKDKKALLQAIKESEVWMDDVLANAIDAASPKVLSWLTDAALGRKCAKAVPPLVRQINKAKENADPVIVRQLGQFKTKDAHDALARMCGSDNAKIRGMGWDGLVACVEGTDLKLIEKELSRGAGAAPGASDALATLATNPELTRSIEEMLDRELRVRDGADALPYAQALAKMPASDFKFLMRDLIRKNDPNLRALGVKGLARDPANTLEIADYLKHEKAPQVVEAGIEVYAQNPSYQAVPRLLEYMASNVPSFQTKARKALVNTFGVDQGPYAHFWKVWMDSGKYDNDPGREKVFSSQKKDFETKKKKMVVAR